MPVSDVNERVIREFEMLSETEAGRAVPSVVVVQEQSSTVPEALERTSREIQGLATVSLQQTQAVATNTQAVLANVAGAPPSSQGGDSIASTFGNIAKSVFTSGLGLAPLVSGIVQLFRGGDDPQPAPLVRYTPPPAVRFQAANTRAGIADADYGQDGMARGYAGGVTNLFANTAAPQIQIQVQAMDSRSFLDHSSEIAQAVREAMLNMHAINDVVTDL